MSDNHTRTTCLYVAVILDQPYTSSILSLAAPNPHAPLTEELEAFEMSAAELA
jgi:hypothetical protein